MSKYFSLTVSTSKYFNRVCSHVILNAWVFSVIMVAMVIIFQHLLILKSAKNRKCKRDNKQKNETQYCCIYLQSFGGRCDCASLSSFTLYGKFTSCRCFNMHRRIFHLVCRLRQSTWNPMSRLATI